MNSDLRYIGTVTVMDEKKENHTFEYYGNDDVLVRLDWDTHDSAMFPPDDAESFILDDMTSGTIVEISDFLKDDIIALLRYTEGEKEYTDVILKLVEKL